MTYTVHGRLKYDFDGMLQRHCDSEDYVQRMEAKHWKVVLLYKRDSVIFQGRTRKLVAKSIGFGVVEVSKAPIEEG